MLLGAVLAFYYSQATGFSLLDFDIGLFIIGFLVAGPLLWGGLYALNDYTDWQKDKLHAVKRKRPIPSGQVKPNLALAWAGLLIVLSFTVALTLNNFLFTISLLLMLINQLLYTLPPIHLKKKPVLDLISGSLINPLFRFYAGWALFLPVMNAPLLVILFILGFQFGGYTLYRLSGKKLEQSLDYKSSIVVFGEKNMKLIAYAGMIIGGVSYIAATLIGVLPFRFIWLSVLSFLFIPLYLNALKDPQGMDIEKMHRLVYLHYIGFMIGFILLFLI